MKKGPLFRGPSHQHSFPDSEAAKLRRPPLAENESEISVEGRTSSEQFFPDPVLSGWTLPVTAVTVVVIPFLLVPVNASGQSAEPTAYERARRSVASGKSAQASADKRTSGSAAERTLLSPGHVGAAHGPESHSAHKKYNNGKFLHHITPNLIAII